MKHLLVIIGTLFFLSAQHVEAQTAVSPYVEDILTRTDEALSRIPDESPVAMFFEEHDIEWLLSFTSAIVLVIDTETHIVAQQASLAEQTACLRTDLFLLEERMERVRQMMWDVWEEQNASGIFELMHLLFLLQDKYELILKGYRDPTVRDVTWYESQYFEPIPESGWCCIEGGQPAVSATPQECRERGRGSFPPLYTDSLTMAMQAGCTDPDGREAEVNPPQCPFDSDYLPPSTVGYGCDVQAMDRAVRALSEFGDSAMARTLSEEITTLRDVQSSLEQTLALAASFRTAEGSLSEILGTGSEERSFSLTSTPAVRSHKKRSGCMLEGACADDLESSCQSDDDCDGASCVEATHVGTCEDDGERRCLDSSDCEEGSACLTLEGAVWQELRGNFSLHRNELNIMREFTRLWEEQGAKRPAPAYLENNFLDELMSFFKKNTRGNLQEFAVDQEGKAAVTFAIGSDPGLSVAEAMTPFTDSVRRLARLANEMDGGLRGFVRDLAYFLRRTCIDRPCNQKLDSILKLIFADACFPYASGEYLEDTPENPRYRKCCGEAFFGDSESAPEECEAGGT